MNFLETLYLDGYAPSEEDFPRTAEYQQAVKHAQQYEEQIIKQMGEQFLSDYHSAKAEHWHTPTLKVLSSLSISFSLVENKSKSPAQTPVIYSSNNLDTGTCSTSEILKRVSIETPKARVGLSTLATKDHDLPISSAKASWVIPLSLR